jgi:hypothetical protein
MKTPTDTIISALRILARDIQTDDGVANACLDEAAGRLEELQRANKNALADLAVAIEQRDEALLDCEYYKRFAPHPEPSRLEIAAMLLAAMCGSQYTWTNAEGLALRKADVLIEAAKETK